MKKRLLTILLSLVAATCLTFALTACGGNKTECEKNGHSFATEWTSDTTDHWHKCANCDEISDKAAHVYDKEVVADEYRASEATKKERKLLTTARLLEQRRIKFCLQTAS